MTEWLTRASGLEGLEPDAQQLLAELHPIVVPKGSILFSPGDSPSGFVLVLSGRVDVSLTGPQGRGMLLYSVQPGETCIQTTMGLLGEDDYSGEAVAERDLSIVLVPKAMFNALINRSDVFRKFVFHAFAMRMHSVTQLLEQVAFVRIETRLADAILDLATDEGEVHETHQALATRIGSSREVVSRRLEALKKRGLVTLDRGVVRIMDRVGLQQLAKSEL